MSQRDAGLTDPGLLLAAGIKRQNMEWTLRRVAKAAGISEDRCRKHLLACGLLTTSKPQDIVAAPAWYHRPPGRIIAQRRVEGIKL